MEQRRLRLGDILDDYCPRERRVTNHVIVAMIEDDVKQTRCSTCDADHEYKQARIPSTRRKKDAGALSADIAADALRARRPDVADSDDAHDDPTRVDPGVVIGVLEGTGELVAEADPMPAAVLVALPVVETPDPPQVDEREDDGPVHRRLIRATLPRPEGQVPERKETEFTVRQQQGRGGGREIDGNRPSQGQNRHRRPPQRSGGERAADTRFGGAPPGNNRRGGGGGQSNRPGPSQQGQSGSGNPQGGPRSGAPGGEGRFRRRRGR